ncbi:28S ribosomal protein S10, mitochondrial-like, partial [Stegodyphus dumicola]|uniref:28S ribosomal protein S10, mitochondrial-like n=1 Tax=Stegodyphus dumicola TaxID=202533 RepID=UPI0015AE4C0C
NVHRILLLCFKIVNLNYFNINFRWEPKKHHARRTLLKSVFIYKKHRVQYEFRTYFRIFELKHLTGSTADTYLEYIQRNLPEGVSMKVTKHRIEKLPEHIANYVPEKKPSSVNK